MREKANKGNVSCTYYELLTKKNKLRNIKTLLAIVS